MKKSRTVAILLAFFFGVIGAQYYYVRKWKLGIACTVFTLCSVIMPFALPFMIIIGISYALWLVQLTDSEFEALFVQDYKCEEIGSYAMSWKTQSFDKKWRISKLNVSDEVISAIRKVGKIKKLPVTAHLQKWGIVCIPLVFIGFSLIPLLGEDSSVLEGFCIISPIALICYFLSASHNYRPQKSFWIYRFGKKPLLWIVLIGQILFVIVGIIIMLNLDRKQQGGFIIPMIALACSFPYTIMQIRKHEDVDYVTKTNVEDLIGLEIDEKTTACYQNFDSSEEVKKGSFFVVITTRKVFFAGYDGLTWHTTHKLLSDITGIGAVGLDNIEIILKFSDCTSLMFGVSEHKASSSANLFVRALLDSVDNALLRANKPVANRRRRVTTDSIPVAVDTPNPVSPSTQIRSIEISDSVIAEIKTSESFISQRNIDL